MERIFSSRLNREAPAEREEWPTECLQLLLYTLTNDGSVRTRRAAMKVLEAAQARPLIPYPLKCGQFRGILNEQPPCADLGFRVINILQDR